MKMLLINIVSIIIFTNVYASFSLAANKQQQCEHNGTKFNPGEIITKDGKRFICEKGQWVKLKK